MLVTVQINRFRQVDLSCFDTVIPFVGAIKKIAGQDGLFVARIFDDLVVLYLFFFDLVHVRPPMGETTVLY